MDHQRVPEYIGHVERDSTGVLWAVLYCEGQVLRREQVRSLRHGKRRVTDLVLSAADSWTAADSRTGADPWTGADPVARMRCPALGGRTGARFHTS